jgi:hypothetical protein
MIDYFGLKVFFRTQTETEDRRNVQFKELKKEAEKMHRFDELKTI